MLFDFKFIIHKLEWTLEVITYKNLNLKKGYFLYRDLGYKGFMDSPNLYKTSMVDTYSPTKKGSLGIGQTKAMIKDSFISWFVFKFTF